MRSQKNSIAAISRLAGLERIVHLFGIETSKWRIYDNNLLNSKFDILVEEVCYAKKEDQRGNYCRI